MTNTSNYSNLKKRWHEIIFEADTFWGKTFDVGLLVAIILSILVVMLESVTSIKTQYNEELFWAEWVFTILFTLEYLARIWTLNKPIRYIFSFFGLIDLLSVMPAYLGIFFPAAHSFLIIRSIRLLRVFRVLKMVRFLGEASQLSSALKASRAKITVFIGAVFILVVILGTFMYVIEGGKNGFTSIPKSIYWAVVTLTTVGYGDIAPVTPLGQALATLIMILGYGIIAVPTGIVSAEFNKANQHAVTTISCEHCGAEGHDIDADFCKKCGEKL